MELWLIRHGETEQATLKNYDAQKKAPNPPLTSKGKMQAQSLAKRVENIEFSRIISSDMDRTIDTASYLLKNRKVELEIEKGIREIDFGDLCCNSWTMFPDYHQKFKQHDTDFPYPNGENGKAVWKRCQSMLESLDFESDEKVAIVCHGGVIRVLVSGLLNLPQAKRFDFGRPVYHCSITRIRFFHGKGTLHTLNEHSHIVGICESQILVEPEDEVKDSEKIGNKENTGNMD